MSWIRRELDEQARQRPNFDLLPRERPSKQGPIPSAQDLQRRASQPEGLVASLLMAGTPPTLAPPPTSSDHDRLCEEAKVFSGRFCAEGHPELVGITDGKAVGTYIESRFKEHLRQEGFFVSDEDQGSAAKGIDLPGLETDIKVTSSRQPQSSAPFRFFWQKIEGLGYHLMLFVYVKTDDRIAFPGIRFIPAEFTGDFQTTKYLRHLIQEDADIEDLVAYLQDRQVPADEASLMQYAEHLLKNPPRQGYLTISNALQWRLQYKRIVATPFDGIRDVLA